MTLNSVVLFMVCIKAMNLLHNTQPTVTVLLLPTIMFSVLIVVYYRAHIQHLMYRATDWVLSIPIIALAPLVVFLIPSLRGGAAADENSIFFGGLLISIRFSATSIQLFLNSEKRLRLEHYSRTWFAMGGSNMGLIFFLASRTYPGSLDSVVT